MSKHSTIIVLNTCPPPIPERKGQRHTFLESVLQAHNTLVSSPTITAHQFLDAMLVWAGRDPQKSKRYLQNVLNAYYLIGVIPHFNLPQDEYCQIASCLDAATDLHKLRLYCLDAFFARLARTGIFWNLAVSIEPFSTSELYAGLKPINFSFDDVARRIRLLTNLGAFSKQGVSYRVSPLGRALSYDPVQTPIKSSGWVIRESLASNDYIDNLNIIDWEE